MKKCACTAHAETHLPPGQPTRAPLTLKSARIAIRSLLASRSWWTRPDALSASAGNMRSPMPARPRQQRPQRPSNKAASLIEASATAEALLFGRKHKGHEGTRRRVTFGFLNPNLRIPYVKQGFKFWCSIEFLN